MYPSFIVLIMAKQQSVFGDATFIACSENNPATHDISQQQSKALSALHFVSEESTSLQSQLVSTCGSFRQSLKDGVIHVAFPPDAMNVV